MLALVELAFDLADRAAQFLEHVFDLVENVFDRFFYGGRLELYVVDLVEV